MPQGNRSNLETLLKMFTPGLPGTLQGSNQLLRGLTNRDPNSVPGFSDIFENFVANVGRQGKRASAELRESFGSRGARFGSDLLRAEGSLQTEIAERLIGGASALREAEANIGLGVAGALRENAGVELVSRERAFDRLMQEFLRRTQPPAFLEPAARFALAIPQPTTVVS